MQFAEPPDGTALQLEFFLFKPKTRENPRASMWGILHK